MTRLVLHFDINGTITPVDTTEPGNNIENANMVVAKSVFGKVINNIWTLNDNPYNEKDSLTYYDYLKSIDMSNYKLRSFTFTEPLEPGNKLAHMIPLLVDSMDTFLFQSFLNVLHKYPDALIVFRTFGLDADEVIDYLRTNEKTTKHFKTVVKGEFSYTNNNHNSILLSLDNNDEPVIGMHKFNELIRTSEPHLALKESYNFWNYNKRNKVCGKQLLGHDEILQIFFDDNDCINVLDDKNSHSVKINTLQALLNDNYYVDFINDILSR